jgi:hypothetical protein
MKVIVCVVTLLLPLSVAQTASEDKNLVFLSLQETPSQWLSNRPVNLFVDPFGEPIKMDSLVIERGPHRRTTWPLLDFPGPGYKRMRGELPQPEDLR